MKTPQRCPRCERSLADPAVPDRLKEYAEEFTLAETAKVRSGSGEVLTMWRCPFCLHLWAVDVREAVSGPRLANRAVRRRMARAARRR